MTMVDRLRGCQMIELNIPGTERIELHHAVFDYNGTLAVDGIPINGIIEKLNILSGQLNIHIITADTFGAVADHIDSDVFNLKILSKENQDVAKGDFVLGLGKDRCAAFGNGRNDAQMLSIAVIGCGIIGTEGAHAETLKHADLVFTSIHDAVDAFIYKKRLTASLRI
jgi:soluble P-type ATPase